MYSEKNFFAKRIDIPFLIFSQSKHKFCPFLKNGHTLIIQDICYYCFVLVGVRGQGLSSDPVILESFC